MNKQRWAIAMLLLLVGAGLMWPTFELGLERTRTTLARQGPDDGLEGTLTHEALILQRGEALYRPIVAEEFVSAPYTPLHTVVLAQLEIDPAQPFRAGRIISVAAMVSVAILIAIFVGGHTRLWPLGVLVALYWLSFAPVQLWATRVKPDPLALVFTAAGLVVASVRRGRFADWAAVLFALAFFTKQTALIAPFAVAVNLGLTDWRRGARYLLTYGLALGAPYLALDLSTGGLATTHIWGLHQRSWWTWELMWKYVALLGWSLPLAGLALLAAGSARREYGYRQALLYAGLAPLGLYGSGEIGAHHNHLLESMLAWCMAGGVGAGLVWERWGAGRGWQLAGVVAGVLLLGQAWLHRGVPEWYRGEYSPPDLERFIPYIQSKSGPVLADNPALLLAAGKEIVFDDPSTMGPAIESGIWDPSVMHRMIIEREYELILLPFDTNVTDVDATGRWTPATIALIAEHYQVEYRDVIFSYVPR